MRGIFWKHRFWSVLSQSHSLCALRAKNTRGVLQRRSWWCNAWSQDLGTYPFAHSQQYSVSNHFHTHRSMKEGQWQTRNLAQNTKKEFLSCVHWKLTLYQLKQRKTKQNGGVKRDEWYEWQIKLQTTAGVRWNQYWPAVKVRKKTILLYWFVHENKIILVWYFTHLESSFFQDSLFSAKQNRK